MRKIWSIMHTYPGKDPAIGFNRVTMDESRLPPKRTVLADCHLETADVSLLSFVNVGQIPHWG